MDGILNTSTETVHRRRPKSAECRTECGATRYVEDEQLDPIDVDEALPNASKCGRCFTDGRGY